MDEYYNLYEVGVRNLEGITPEDLADLEIRIFLGTWCSDSQLQAPQFFKILEYLSFDMEQVDMVALIRADDENRTLFSPGGEEKGWNITHVPTFIFLRNGKEIGRIVEYPAVNLETDFRGYVTSRTE